MRHPGIPQHWKTGRRRADLKNSRENYVRPLSFLVFFAPEGNFRLGGGGGCVYFEAPCGRTLIRPPSFIRLPPLEGYVQSGGVGVYRIWHKSGGGRGRAVLWFVFLTVLAWPAFPAAKFNCFPGKSSEKGNVLKIKAGTGPKFLAHAAKQPLIKPTPNQAHPDVSLAPSAAWRALPIQPPLHMRENGIICPFGVFPNFIVLFLGPLSLYVVFWERAEKANFGPRKDKWWIRGSKTPKPPDMPFKIRENVTTPQPASLLGLASNWDKIAAQKRRKTPKGQMVPFSPGHSSSLRPRTIFQGLRTYYIFAPKTFPPKVWRIHLQLQYPWSLDSRQIFSRRLIGQPYRTHRNFKS